MLIYKDHSDSRDRIVWYGGSSIQLHYQVMLSKSPTLTAWEEKQVRTLMHFPCGVSELHAEMRDFLKYAWAVEADERYACIH